MTKIETARANYLAARKMSLAICEASLAGKATEDEYYAARRVYQAASMALKEAEGV